MSIYDGPWDDDDPHANFKAEVAAYTKSDPLPTLSVLGESTGIPVGALVRYILVRWAGSGAEMLLAMEPVVLQQMQEQIARAEAADRDDDRLTGLSALRQIVAWLKLGEEGKGIR
ncbi:MAG: DUF6027 family protein [Caldilineaceae bacterium]